MLREATTDDIDTLVNHHVAMFREIYSINNQPINETAFHAMELKYREKLNRQLADTSCKAWVIVEENRIRSSAAISLFSAVPIPTDPSIKIAFLHSVYTEKAFRNRGFAQQLVECAMQYCREKDINRIDLAASDAGRSIYQRLGFDDFPYAMRYIHSDR